MFFVKRGFSLHFYVEVEEPPAEALGHDILCDYVPSNGLQQGA